MGPSKHRMFTAPDYCVIVVELTCLEMERKESIKPTILNVGHIAPGVVACSMSERALSTKCKH